jgi:hypothetical protein
MISEETFAREEQRIGKQVNFHDGVWWAGAAPFYYKPVHLFRPFPPKSARPHPLKAFMGYSHQVPDPAQATRQVRWNVLEGDDLSNFSLERLRRNKRHMVRNGIRDCRVQIVAQVDVLLDQMRLINISQARRLEETEDHAGVLRPDYYERHAARWRADMLKIFSHRGHRFVGAFVGDKLAAYVDLIQVEDTWMFGAVKSSDEYLKHRPVDALYFTVLRLASQDGTCKRVLNGDGDERASLTYFKEQFLLTSVAVPYYSRTLLPLDRLRVWLYAARHIRAG